MSGEIIGGAIAEIGSFAAGTSAAGAAGTAISAGVASTAVGAGLNAALAHKGGISIPPPPGAAIIDPSGSAAAAQVRQRQAVAGGLNSTNVPGANSSASFGNATSGSKGLLGQ
jgi:hypothetical protein